MNNPTLSENLKAWKHGRPGELTMDAFIAMAEKLENASNDSSKEYGKLVNDFNVKINRIPEIITIANPNIDFSSGRYQEISLDIENCCTMLSERFYLFSEGVEKLISPKL